MTAVLQRESNCSDRKEVDNNFLIGMCATPAMLRTTSGVFEKETFLI
jgi:hypothetical protein